LIREGVNRRPETIHAIVGFLPSEQRRSVVELWPGAMIDAGAGLRSSSRERGASNKRLSKLLREFADVRSS
jgi:hypothetical protein